LTFQESVIESGTVEPMIHLVWDALLHAQIPTKWRAVFSVVEQLLMPVFGGMYVIFFVH
jgi:hypothetical protein